MTMYGGSIYGANNVDVGTTTPTKRDPDLCSALIIDRTEGTAALTFNMVGGTISGTAVTESDDYTIYAKAGAVVNIGKTAVVNGTAAGNAYFGPWVSAPDLTITGTVNGTVKCTNFVADLEGKPVLVGAAKIQNLVLDNSNTVDATGLTAGAKITVDTSAHNTGIFTTAFESKEAAEAVLPYIVPAEGYQLSVTEDTFQIVQTAIPVENP